MSSPGPDLPAPKRKGEVKRKHTVRRVLLISSLVLAMVTALGVAFIYRHLEAGTFRKPMLEEWLRERVVSPPYASSS